MATELEKSAAHLETMRLELALAQKVHDEAAERLEHPRPPQVVLGDLLRAFISRAVNHPDLLLLANEYDRGCAHLEPPPPAPAPAPKIKPADPQYPFLSRGETT